MSAHCVTCGAHADSFSRALAIAEAVKAEYPRVEVGLVRDVADEVEGLQDRKWAYLEEGKLPAYFSDSAFR